MSTIKIARAKSIAAHLPQQEAAIWSSIPEALCERLTPAELAEVARALNAHWHKAQAHAAAEICRDCAVWDARAGVMREVARAAQSA